jgi:hypothetical protein
MKVLCIKPLEHSGVQSYIRGKTYDIPPQDWEALKKLGATGSFKADNANDKPAEAGSTEKITGEETEAKAPAHRGRPPKDPKEE